MFGDFEQNLPSAPDNVPLILGPQQRQRIRCHALDHRELRNQSSVDQDDSLSASGEGVLFAFCFGHCSLHHCQMCRQTTGLNSSESKRCTPSADEEGPPSCKENMTAAVSSLPFLFRDDDLPEEVPTARMAPALTQWVPVAHLCEKINLPASQLYFFLVEDFLPPRLLLWRSLQVW